MSTSVHSFMNIYNKTFDYEEEQVQLKKIVIPIIQRDYAQGREGTKIERVRNRFLDSLHNAIIEKPITLDFVYGDIDENGVMTPLDGQQRLTTLFLLHWYAANKDNVAEDKYDFLNNFSYETRYSARDFCESLIEFKPTFSKSLRDEIIDQAWFPLDWKKDPTISSMLTMINAIDAKFSDVENMWEKLKEGAIQFYFLPIKDMGLTDELYIKMNSRGKPLTAFEHFKAELEHELRKIDMNIAERVIIKIDIDWTDMLWQYRGDDNVIDDEFLNYFKYICDVIRYRNGDTPQGKSLDEFDLIKECFGVGVPEVKENIQLLEDSFNCWCILQEAPDKFCERFISHVHESGKIKIEQRYKIDVFGDCIATYGKMSGNNRQFPLNRFIILYAVIAYLQNKEAITEEDFLRRIRVVNNLVMNSEDEISDSTTRQGGNRMPAIVKQVRNIILTGEILDDIEINFNVYQLLEEKEKIRWCKEHINQREKLFALEDHPMLIGQIGIVGLEHPEYFERFSNLFSLDKDLVDCALMSIGAYGQKDNYWRYQLGSSGNERAWRNLFHKSNTGDFENTSKVLCNLLDKTDVFTEDYLNYLIDLYLSACEEKGEYEWRYYYVKYKSFRPGRFGKYNIDTNFANPYMMLVMVTALNISENSYQPYLREISESNDYFSRDELGRYLIVGGKKIACENAAFVVTDIETGTELQRLEISQNEEGIDTEDRVVKGRIFFKGLARV